MDPNPDTYQFADSSLQKARDWNYVQTIFLLMSLIIILLGSLVNSFEHLPIFVRQSLRYGKCAYTGKEGFLKPIKLPKSWFRHFYVYSAFLASFSLIVTIYVLVFDYAVPNWLYDLLDMACSSTRVSTASASATVLAMSLLTLQCLRRFYETQFVSVFAKSGQMDSSQYIVGYIHYTGCVLAILGEAPKFASSTHKNLLFNWADLTYYDLGATMIFLWAWWHQYKLGVILANLRKNKKGEVVSEAHKLPHGDWFDYVSSPHLLAEILMYLSLTVILRGNVTWFYVFVWVLVNQCEVGLINHWWYQENFDDLPKHRKAIIPFIY